MILLSATGWAACLFADVVWDLRLTTLTLVGVLLLGAVAVAVTARWRKRFRNDDLSASDQLAEFRSLYLEGAISKDEFERLRAVLGGEMRKELQVPASAKPAASTQAAEPEAPQSPAPTEPTPPAPEPPAHGVQPDGP
jgi:hypothetical protein